MSVFACPGSASEALRRRLDVTSTMPFAYASGEYSASGATIRITVGELHVWGDTPSAPTPRVTTRRM